MYNFFPEKIYNILKTDPIYIKWDNIINSLKNNNNTSFVKSLTLDYTLLSVDKEQHDTYMSEIIGIIDEKCPEYKTEFFLIMLDLSKRDLLALYNECQYDTETTLFLISQLINTSYADREFAKYINQYVITYNSIPVIERPNYSAYCHIKYLSAASENEMLSVPKDKYFLPTMIDYVTTLKEDLATVLDADKLENAYLEVIDHMICNAMYYINDDTIIAANIEELNFHEDDLSFQYSEYSCSKAGIKDKKLEIYFSNRDFLKAFKTLKQLFEYVDNALLDINTFLKGLEYYDKINNYPMAVIIRRMLKLADRFPQFGFELVNLSSDDKEFLLKNDLASTSPANHVVPTTFGNFIKHVDDWMLGNECTFDMIDKYGGIDELAITVNTADGE